MKKLIKKLLGIQSLSIILNQVRDDLQELDDRVDNCWTNEDFDPDDFISSLDYRDDLERVEDKAEDLEYDVDELKEEVEELKHQNERIHKMLLFLATHINNQDVLDMLNEED